MGLSSTTNRVSYVGDGSSATFSFPYYFFTTQDLSVYLYDNGSISGSSVVYPQVLNTNYTISGQQTTQGIFPFGGNVVMNSSVPSNRQIVVTRSPSPINNYVLNQNGNINSLALVQQFDYLTALVQRLQDEVSRSVQLPDGLGTVNGNTFNTILPSSLVLAASGNAPILLNSGATGFQLGFVVSGSGGTASGFAGTMPVINGGTGQALPLTPGALWYSADVATLGQLSAGPAGQLLTSNGSSAPSWASLSAGAIGSGVLSVSFGGTGTAASSYPQFGLIYASSSTQFSAIPSSTAGLILQANGSSAPTWSTFSIASSVTGTLQVGFGGTGTASSYPQYGIIYASSTTQFGTVSTATPGLPLLAQGSSAPIFGALNISASSSSTIGALPIAAGGTGGVTANAGFNALSPITAHGDLIVGSGSSAIGIRKAVGSNGQFLKVDTTQAGSITWAAVSAQPSFNVVSKTSAYSANFGDFVLVSAGSFSIALPDAPAGAGQSVILKKTDSSFLNLVTIVASAAQTIDSLGSTRTLNSLNEQYTLVSDGNNWQIEDHLTETPWTAYTPQFTGFGTVTAVNFMWKRKGDTINISGRVTSGTVSGAGTVAQITLASSLIVGTLATPMPLGFLFTTANSNYTFVICSTSASAMLFSNNTIGLFTVASNVGTQIIGNAGVFGVIANEIPIQGWFP